MLNKISWSEEGAGRGVGWGEIWNLGMILERMVMILQTQMVYYWARCWCCFVGLLRSGVGCCLWPRLHCCGSICYFHPFGKSWFGFGCYHFPAGELCFESGCCFHLVGFFLVLLCWVCGWVPIHFFLWDWLSCCLCCQFFMWLFLWHWMEFLQCL